jgi:Nif-specific regulatory protein
MTFICVPITVDNRTAGALGVNLRYDKDRNYDRAIKFFGVVASMIAQAIRVNKLIEAERQRLIDENLLLRQELRERYDFRNIIGNSHGMRQVYEQVAQVAPTNTTVLIRGESGTGKELIAHAIHYNSPRANKPFVKVSCGALPESLIESELFGYEPGAFTDARAQKKGRFELAHGGTLFLDEVGELSQSTQIKLLRVLQEREFERLGGVQPIKVNVRLIAATNKDLEVAIKQGTFREDLYYRLNVGSIDVPPLRARRADVLPLARHFLAQAAVAMGLHEPALDPAAQPLLERYSWPGNARELRNVMERALILSGGAPILPAHLPREVSAPTAGEPTGAVALVPLAEAERRHVKAVLDACGGNKTQAAKLLGISRVTLRNKLSEYGWPEGAAESALDR